jgi:hypothetical protein
MQVVAYIEINPLKIDVDLNYLYEIISYLTENKDQLMNIVQGSNRCLFWGYVTHKYSV